MNPEKDIPVLAQNIRKQMSEFMQMRLNQGVPIGETQQEWLTLFLAGLVYQIEQLQKDAGVTPPKKKSNIISIGTPIKE